MKGHCKCGRVKPQPLCLLAEKWWCEIRYRSLSYCYWTLSNGVDKHPYQLWLAGFLNQPAHKSHLIGFVIVNSQYMYAGVVFDITMYYAIILGRLFLLPQASSQCKVTNSQLITYVLIGNLSLASSYHSHFSESWYQNYCFDVRIIKYLWFTFF